MFEQIKITKKEYYGLIKENVHYNLGTVWTRQGEVLEDKIEEVEAKLSDKDTFNNPNWLEENCLKCIGSDKNTVDFLHIQENKDTYLHEPVKGKFFKVVINGLLYVYHYYNDNSNTVSFKCIV